jgi:hypothetical protein
MKKVSDQIPAYNYGTPVVETSPVSRGRFYRRGRALPSHRWRGARRTDKANRRPLAQRHHRQHSESRPALAYAGRRAQPRIPCQNQSSLRAMDSRHVSPPLRSGLAELPAGNRAEAHKRQEESSRWRPINRACSLSRCCSVYCRSK